MFGFVLLRQLADLTVVFQVKHYQLLKARTNSSNAKVNGGMQNHVSQENRPQYTNVNIAIEDRINAIKQTGKPFLSVTADNTQSIGKDYRAWRRINVALNTRK